MSPLFTLFLVTSFANIATPGIGAVMAVNLGLSQGWKRAIPGCLGIAIGIAFLFVIALSGTGAVLATHPAAFSVIQLIGAAFLAYLGIRSILKKPKHASLIGRHDDQTESGFSQFMKCAAISAANPQPIIFGLTVLPSFIDPTFSYVLQSAVMIAIYALIVFLSFRRQRRAVSTLARFFRPKFVRFRLEKTLCSYKQTTTSRSLWLNLQSSLRTLKTARSDSRATCPGACPKTSSISRKSPWDTPSSWDA